MATNTKGFKISKTQHGQELSKYTGKDTNIEIPDNVEIIGHSAFDNNADLISIKIPSSVKKIGFDAFRNCKNLESVELSEGLQEIEWSAFYGCSSLKEIIIPRSVKSIASKAFFGCEQLSKFVLNHEVQLDESFIDEHNSLPAVDGFVMIQNHLVKYVGLESEVKVPDSIKVIGERSFYENKEIKTVSLPDSVVKICDNAFYNCSNLESIKIPSGVETIGYCAFYGCSKLDSVVLPSGINMISSSMFENCSALRSIRIPSNITYIGHSAFERCTGLEQVELSENLETIEWSAFCRCSSLKEIRIPNKVEKIGERAFEDCTGLEKIELPKNIQEMEKGAFENTKWQKDQIGNCILDHYLIDYREETQTVEIPQEVETIAGGAFQGNYHIETAIIPPNVKRIMSYAFDSCYTLKTVELHHLADIKEHNFTSCGELDPTTFDDETLVCFYLSTEKNKAANECRDLIIKKGLDYMYDSFEKLLKDCDNPVFYERFAKLLVSAKEILTQDIKDKIASLFEDVSDNKILKLLVKNDIIRGDQEAESKKKADTDKQSAIREKEREEDEIKLKKGLRPDEKEIEEFAKNYLETNSIADDAKVTIKDIVLYKNSHIRVSAEVLSVLLNEYVKEWKKNCSIEYGEMNDREDLYSGNKVKISKIADHVFSYLDENSAILFLKKLAYSTKYRPYILSYARFAGETTPDFIGTIKGRKKGTAKEKYWANNAEQSLLINDTLYAMKYFDSVQKLNVYARMRGIKEQELRELKMMPDFGLDKDLKVYYESGDYRISAKLKPDYKFELFDENSQKAIKAFPSKGITKDELDRFKTEFNSLKKEVSDFIKNKTLTLSRMHISGEEFETDLWKQAYIDNYLVRYLTRGLVWADDSGTTFTINDNGIINSDGNLVEPREMVSLAHVCDMKKDVIAKWQRYFIDNNISQPFVQVWEPVVNVDENELKKYQGMCLSSRERNQLKSELKKKGIDVYSDELEREFNPRRFTYEFSNRNTMHLGNYVDINYTINDDNSIVFDNMILTSKEYSDRKPSSSGKTHSSEHNLLNRHLNAIMYEIGKLAIMQNIKKDNAEALTNDILDIYTLAQIAEFIDISNDNGSINCSARLLDYKNTVYGTDDYMNDLVLDLI